LDCAIGFRDKAYFEIKMCASEAEGFKSDSEEASIKRRVERSASFDFKYERNPQVLAMPIGGTQFIVLSEAASDVFAIDAKKKISGMYWMFGPTATRHGGSSQYFMYSPEDYGSAIRDNAPQGDRETANLIAPARESGSEVGPGFDIAVTEKIRKLLTELPQLVKDGDKGNVDFRLKMSACLRKRETADHLLAVRAACEKASPSMIMDKGWAAAWTQLENLRVSGSAQLSPEKGDGQSTTGK
jgi:hypothetical protein